MTEKWKSNPMHWCDLCKVWMQDNPSARQTHERGIKHVEALQMKLRSLRTGAARKQADEKKTAATLKVLEEQAAHQYQEDLKDAHAAEATTRGRWEPDEGSGHLYNALHRYYYSRANGLYYGGDPPAWTHTPKMPPEARYKEPPKAEEEAQTVTLPTGFVRRTNTQTGAKAAAGAKLVIKAHPQAGIGGHRLPQMGQVGSLKGVGALTGLAGGKRKAEGGGAGRGKPISAAEQEALDRREAAKKRVEARTLKSFGMSAP